MAHYAFIDSNNIVMEVIVGKDEGEDGVDWELKYSEIRGFPCKRTSYNTHEGIYYDPNTNQPSPDQSKAFRKNYAGIGYFFDETRNAFIPPKPYPSWLLEEFSCVWKAPVPYPDDGNVYIWDETTLSWVLFVPPQTTE